MALLDDLVGSSLGLGILGVGAVLLAPTVLPVVGRVLRPVIKEAAKGVMVLCSSTAEMVSEATAEARAELRTPPGSPTGG